MNDIERARKNRELKKLVEEKPLRSDWIHLPGNVPMQSLLRDWTRQIQAALPNAKVFVGAPMESGFATRFDNWWGGGTLLGPDGRPLRRDKE